MQINVNANNYSDNFNPPGDYCQGRRMQWCIIANQIIPGNIVSFNDVM
jgi:hypothetical protein